MAKYFSLIILFFFSILISAQGNGESEDKIIREATKIAKQAERLWKEDKYLEAEGLYYKSLSIYPLYLQLNEFAERKIKIGDIKGANKVWDDLEKKILKVAPVYFKDSDLRYILEQVYSRKARLNFDAGDSRVAVNSTINYLEVFRNRKPGSASHSLIESACNVAFFLDDKISLLKINSVCQTLDNNMFGDAKFGQFISEIYFEILNKNYDAAERKLTDVSENKGGFIGSRSQANLILAYLYLYKGDYKKMEESVGVLKSNAPGILSEKTIDKFISNFYGFIAFYKGDYNKAIEQFTIYLNRKAAFGVKVPVAEKFKYYNIRAEAYEGLKEFDKAKKDYEAALIYYPEFEPALNGLARLEGRVITERLTDKIPPQIILTEPLPARGIIIEAAGNEVMIKGTATDQGGLKSVTINGEKVYSQEGGTFWGNAVLKDGSNKVTIIATDFSGNSAEKIIEVERPVSTSIANAVPVKEGKNFALLIGCQNYDDSNIPSLEDPIPDAIKLKLILKNSYNFGDDNVFTLFNPERSDFKKQFLEIYEVIQPEDNLVIFYAGHGIWVDKDKKGYWMLTDAKLNDVNTWLPNKEVLDMIARVPARHTLLITDACFSGSVFRTRGLNTDMPTAIQKINEKISRVAITSGNDTEVPDKSVFMKYLVKALSENKEKYMTAQKMFINQIIEAVMTETKTEPRYGTLELAGHVGGDYIFIRK